MSATADVENILLLVLAALVPAVVYLTWVRTTERGQREGLSVVLGGFAYGALFATIVAGAIEAILVAGGTSISHAVPGPEFTFLNGNTTAGALFLVLVIAPFVEEGFKALGVVNYRRALRTIADGPVVGASVGLGFGFFETFLYGVAAYLTGGLVAGLALIVVRSLSSVLLHGSSTAFFGYGYAEAEVTQRGHAGASHYFGAVGLHSGFNAVVSLGTFAMVLGYSTSIADALNLVGVGLGILLAFSAIEYVRRLIVQASYPGALAAHPRFRPPSVRAAAGGRTPPRP
ncbi:MAG TPA: PrsW family glutamic-type intramembrane protease [Thermoplasmata archaeon]|nr:PrsW family glutamic-type intramembrane protease [Thermoplasmata archaeon]